MKSHSILLWLNGFAAFSSALKQVHLPVDVDAAASVVGAATITAATDWPLPTPRPESNAFLAKANDGRKGHLVATIVTTTRHDLERRQTDTATDEPSSTNNQHSNTTASTGQPTSTHGSGTVRTVFKVGIGVGVGLGLAFILACVGFLLFRWRKKRSKRRAAGAKDHENHAEMRSDDVKKAHKAEQVEMATGPPAAGVAPVELPDRSLQTPPEVPGDGYPGIGAQIERPAELPAVRRDAV